MADEPRRNERAFRWWRELQPNESHPDPARRSGNRAALARLRRCTRIEEAASEREALALARCVGITHALDSRLGDALLAAIILAQVRQDDRSAAVARQLGAPGGDQRAVMSPFRFSRLLTADTIEDRLVAFRRAVALLGGRAHVPSLATALLDWSERTRIIWAFDYHNAPHPGTADVTTPTREAGDASGNAP